MFGRLKAWADLALWAPELFLGQVVRWLRPARRTVGRFTRVDGIVLPLAPDLPRQGAFLEYLRQIANGSYEPHTVHVIRKTLSRGGVFFDVGANIGYFAAVAAACVGPRGQVHVFDVDPRCIANLQALKARNPRYQIHPIHAAIGSSSGSVRFEPRENCTWTSLRDATGGVGTGELTTVPGVTLSEYILRDRVARPDLLKIDVEGLEYEVLRGLQPYLERERRRLPILMEITGDSPPLMALIDALGYSIRSTVPPFRPVRSFGEISNVVLVPRRQ